MSTRYGRDYGSGYESDRSGMDRDYEYESSRGGMNLQERGGFIGGRDRDYERHGRERGYGPLLGSGRDYGPGRDYENYRYGREGGYGLMPGSYGRRDYPLARDF